MATTTTTTTTTGCVYLNGPIQIICAQFLTFAGACFSFAALGDCAFAEVDNPLNIIPGVNFPAQRIGFITFEGFDGQCYWYDKFTDIVDPEDQLQAYWDILGTGWQKVGVVGYAAAAFSWYFFWYTTSFCCSSQVKAVRYINGFTMSVILTVLQGCTFIALGTGLCNNDGGCSFGRSAGWSIGAILCYFFAGLAFFATTDYPGNRWQPPPHSNPYHEDTPQVIDAAYDNNKELEPEHLEAQTY
jgi:hypothetical protein